MQAYKNDQYLKILFKLMVILCSISVIYFSKQILLIWLLIALCVAVVLKKTDRKVFCVSVVLLLVIQPITGHTFQMFVQIKDILHVSVIGLIEAKHPHLLRFLVVHPAIFISKVKGANIDSCYNYYCIILLGISAVIIKNCVQMLSPKRKLSYIFATACLFLMSLAMNGRLIPAYLGLLIIIYTSAKLFFYKDDVVLPASKLMLLFLGFFLSTVSSGTMMITLTVAVACILVLATNSKKTFCTIFTFVFLAVISILVLTFALFMTIRNLMYFIGLNNIIGLFDHGLGKYLGFSFIMIILVLVIFPPILIIASAYFRYIILKKIEFLPVIISIPVALLGGIFGISTATMMFPALILFTTYYLPTMTLKEVANESLLRDKQSRRSETSI